MRPNQMTQVLVLVLGPELGAGWALAAAEVRIFDRLLEVARGCYRRFPTHVGSCKCGCTQGTGRFRMHLIVWTGLHTEGSSPPDSRARISDGSSIRAHPGIVLEPKLVLSSRVHSRWRLLWGFGPNLSLCNSSDRKLEYPECFTVTVSSNLALGIEVC